MVRHALRGEPDLRVVSLHDTGRPNVGVEQGIELARAVETVGAVVDLLHRPLARLGSGMYGSWIMRQDLGAASLGAKRTLEMAAIFMIGDGMLGLLQPRRHVDLWRTGFAGVDVLVRPFAERTRGRRLYGLLQIAAGTLLAASLQP